MRRRDFMAGAAALAAPLPSFAVERVGDRRSLVFSGGQPVPVLDPPVRYDWSTRMMQQGVYDALLKYVGNPAKAVPWLAERWETSEDGRVWTFHLVGNARFHNGDPVEAEAVRFSFHGALRLNKGVAWMLKSALDPSGIEAIDPLTVRITLKEPYGPFLSFVPLWFIVNPKQVTGEDDGQKFLTDGRWPMAEADRPAGVIYHAIREPAPCKAALQRGEIDIVTEMTPDYDQLAKGSGIEVTDDKGMTPFTIQINTQKRPTADLNFRKARAYAFDYDALL